MTGERRSSITGLLMSRREGEQIVVNNGEILIEVVSVRGKYVRLCFAASKEILIRRVDDDEKSLHDCKRK